MLSAYLLLVSLVAGPGTRADREALFDYLLEKTMARESFSEVKNRTLGLDVRAEMLGLRGELVDAETDLELFHALIKLSNVRKDSHLSVDPVSGGLAVDTDVLRAPIRFLPDYSDPGDPFVFVSDRSDAHPRIALGDRVVAVNGREDFALVLEPYLRYSTVNKLWWELARVLPETSDRMPVMFHEDELRLRLERSGGERYDVSLPYADPDASRLTGADLPRYPDFDLAFRTETYDLYRHFGDGDVLLLAWHGFRATLVPDVDRLVAYAVENELFDHAVIVDATRSRGGSKGAYAVQRLTGRPFRTTFGNLRLSDITREFVEDKKLQFDESRLLDGDAAETIDDGSWLMDWLLEDVLDGLDAGQDYSNDVPFKLAHLPKYSDGIVRPAENHFRGPLVVLLGPHGGSHLDQFASIVADNDLGYLIGMPAGGYSNTWEWEETLVLPTTGEPLVTYMWSIGHTLRPNGEVLEGNPAPVDEHVPLTRDNFRRYHGELLRRAFRHLKLN